MGRRLSVLLSALALASFVGGVRSLTPTFPAAVSAAPAGRGLAPSRNLQAQVQTALQRDGGPGYALRPTAAGLSATNPAQRFEARFSAAGVTLAPHDPAASRGPGFGLEVTHLALDGRPSRLDAAPPTGSGARVERRRRSAAGHDLVEWYVNGPLGLQQGFTVDRPAAGSAAALAIDLRLAGGWRATVAANGREATLEGAEPLSFGPLLAWDAEGRDLEARMVATDDGLRYEVETRGASWPVTIDPILRYLRLAPADLLPFDAFGSALDVDGETAVIGAPFVDLAPGSSQGAAYVFTRNPTTGAWTQTGARLVAPAPYDVNGANFGTTVVIDGDWMAISADGDNEGIIPRVFVYRRTGTTWAIQQVLSPPGLAIDGFGVSLALEGTTLVVGEPYWNGSQGRAFVYVWNGSSWLIQQIVAASGTPAPAGGDYFAIRVSVIGDRLAVGAYQALGTTTDTGAVYVFTRAGTVWSQLVRLIDPAGLSFDFLGWRVALDGRGGHHLLAGAYGAGTNGKALLYRWTGSAYAAPITLTSTATTNIGITLDFDDWRRPVVGGNDQLLVFAQSTLTSYALMPTWTHLTLPTGSYPVAASGSVALTGNQDETNGGAAYGFPLNDARLAASYIDAATSTVVETLDTHNASFDAADPIPSCGTTGANRAKSVWFRFNGRSDGGGVRLRAEALSPAGYDPVMALYQTASLTPVACNDNGGGGTAAQITFTPTAGTLYYVMIADDNGVQTGTEAGGGVLRFTYQTVPPTITSRSPARGTTAGRTSVTLAGTGFLAGSTTVTVGGQPATNLQFAGTTTLTFDTPPGAAGTVAIDVTNGGGSASTPFEYVASDVRRLTGARKPSFSFDGRHMAFESPVGLRPGDTNGISDIYVLDKVSGALARVSVSSAGAQAIGGESFNPSISATGRYLAFESRATNLVPGDTNGLPDVFWHDRDADGDGIFDEPGGILTLRISIATAGTEAVGGYNRNPSISGSGRWVVFESASTNLVGSDTNNLLDICVHDRLLGITKRLNVSSRGEQSLGGPASRPRISLDGRWVVFDSTATNLVGGDTNGVRDVFLHDRDNDGDGVMDEVGQIHTGRVSVNAQGVQGNGPSQDASVTGDGRYIVFESLATNLDFRSPDTNGESDIFLHDRVTGETRRLSLGPGGAQFIGPSRAPRISANGALLVFLTSGLNASAPLTGAGVFGALDDGKSTTGTIPSPTSPTPPPADVDPPSDTENNQDPEVSGDGSQTGSTAQPTPGSGGAGPTIEQEGVAEGAEESPFIAGLAPTQGPTTGGNVVDIQGAHFTGATSVRWGAASLGVQVVSANLIRVTAPASGAGPVEVQVRNGALIGNTVTYTYQAALSAPVITTVAPANGPVTGGTAVTITGSGFVGTTATLTVRFGPAFGAVTNVTGTTVTATTPASLAAGPVPVVVTNSDGAVAVSPGPFTYEAVPAPPSVTAVQPTSGPAGGGTSITVIGAGFAPGATVSVGGAAAADVQILSSVALVATTPPGTTGSQPVRVSVGGQISNDGAFTYEAAVAPVTACTGPGDADGDSIPDDWELQFGLSDSDPGDAALDWDLDGRTNLEECADATHPRGLYTRFLAEGATGSFFSTRIAIGNPAATPARVLFRFTTQTGTVVPYYLAVPPQSRRTLDLATIPGLVSANVSTVMESDVEVVVDRTMRWDQATRGGAHAESSVPVPALRWYLAEGATHGSFDLFYLIQNPSLTTAAQIQIRFLLPSGAPQVRTYTVNPNTRFTLPVDTVPGLEAVDVSAEIESTNNVPVIVERAMYSSAAGTFAAGHDSAGVTALSTTWFFAEGATGGFFDYFLLLANPGGTDAQVQARYLLPNAPAVTKTYTVPANSRRTFNVAFEDAALRDTAVSVALTATNGVPVIAERSMWWPSGRPWFEAHNSAGSTTTGIRWGLGDGEVGPLPEDAATYLLVANTSAFVGQVRVTLLFESGAPLTQDFTVPANSRFNVPVVSLEYPANPGYLQVPRGTRFSAIVESLGVTPAQIVVERAMYWNAGGVVWAAGSNLLATKLQ